MMNDPTNSDTRAKTSRKSVTTERFLLTWLAFSLASWAPVTAW